MSDWNDRIVTEFRENDGKVGGPFQGAHLLLLGTTGAKTREPRLSPMMYFDEPDGIFVIASKAGAPEHPGWYHNLVANPAVTVERATDGGVLKYDGVASPVAPELRDALYARLAAQRPGFGEYQEKTSRVIPIVKIERKK